MALILCGVVASCLKQQGNNKTMTQASMKTNRWHVASLIHCSVGCERRDSKMPPEVLSSHFGVFYFQKRIVFWRIAGYPRVTPRVLYYGWRKLSGEI
eukprot:scaffold218219_cov55-Attheya_sp.AAC.5